MCQFLLSKVDDIYTAVASTCGSLAVFYKASNQLSISNLKFLNQDLFFKVSLSQMRDWVWINLADGHRL